METSEEKSCEFVYGNTETQMWRILLMEFFFLTLFKVYSRGSINQMMKEKKSSKDCGKFLFSFFLNKGHQQTKLRVQRITLPHLMKMQNPILMKLKPLTSHSCILMMFCQTLSQTLLIGFHQYTPKTCNKKQQVPLPHFWSSFLQPL